VPSVLWAGVAESSPLADLHAASGAAIAACGLEVERRPYVPHVTLARLTPAVPRAWTDRVLGDTARLEIDGLPVEQFRLFERRRLDGATGHSIAATFPLVT
jgi:2'-5' RNA ligase